MKDRVPEEWDADEEPQRLRVARWLVILVIIGLATPLIGIASLLFGTGKALINAAERVLDAAVDLIAWCIE